MAEPTILDEKNFASRIAEGVSLVDFYAEWCGPCRKQSPVLAALAGQYPTLKIFKVNVDQSPELAARFEITGIPYLALFRNGGKIRDWMGLQSAETLQKSIEQVLWL